MRRSIASFASFIIIHGQIERIVHYRTFRAFCSLTEFRTPCPLSYVLFTLTIDGIGGKTDARPRIDPQHTTVGESVWNHRHRLAGAVCQYALNRQEQSWLYARWAWRTRATLQRPRTRPATAMTMTSGLRKFTLTAHVTSSVGLLGAIAGFLAFAVVGLTKPGCTDGACRLVDRPVRHRPVGLRFAVNWDCAVTGHHVWPVSALVGPGETSADHLCHHRLAGQDGSNRLRSPLSRRDDIVPCRSPRSGDPTRGPRCRWFVGVARARGTLG